MRIACAFGEFVFGHIARLWIEFSDVALGICREPDIAILIADKTMGPERGVLRWYSLTWPVFGSTCPITLAYMPVYQIEPSGAAHGSWGRDPLVGSPHSLKETVTLPGTTTAGFGPSPARFLSR